MPSRCYLESPKGTKDPVGRQPCQCVGQDHQIAKFRAIEGLRKNFGGCAGQADEAAASGMRRSVGSNGFTAHVRGKIHKLLEGGSLPSDLQFMKKGNRENFLGHVCERFPIITAAWLCIESMKGWGLGPQITLAFASDTQLSWGIGIITKIAVTVVQTTGLMSQLKDVVSCRRGRRLLRTLDRWSIRTVGGIKIRRGIGRYRDKRGVVCRLSIGRRGGSHRCCG